MVTILSKNIQTCDTDPTDAVNLSSGKVVANATAGAGQCDPIAGLGGCLLAAWWNSLQRFKDTGLT